MVFTPQQLVLVYPNVLGHTVDDIKLLLSMLDDSQGPFRFLTDWELDVQMHLAQPMLAQDEDCIHALEKIIRDGTQEDFHRIVWETPLRDIPLLMGQVRNVGTTHPYLRVACLWRFRVGH